MQQGIICIGSERRQSHLHIRSRIAVYGINRQGSRIRAQGIKTQDASVQCQDRTQRSRTPRNVGRAQRRTGIQGISILGSYSNRKPSPDEQGSLPDDAGIFYGQAAFPQFHRSGEAGNGSRVPVCGNRSLGGAIENEGAGSCFYEFSTAGQSILECNRTVRGSVIGILRVNNGTIHRTNQVDKRFRIISIVRERPITQGTQRTFP